MRKVFYYIACTATVFLWGCQQSIVEPILPIPKVMVRIEMPKEAAPSPSGKNNVPLGSNRVYLFPLFDYPADPVVVDAQGASTETALLPGSYRAVVHSLPIEPLVMSGTDNPETFAVSLPTNEKGELPECPRFYTLQAADPMKSVGIVKVEEGPNVLVFQPVLVTKRVRFVLNTAQFGTITSAHGTLSGVASELNLHTLKTNMGKSVQLTDIKVEGNTLVIEAFELLGFTVSNPDDEVVLNLLVRNDEVDFELEQPIDLTEEMKKVQNEGGDVDIKIDVKFNPDIRVHPVTIKQWDEHGNEIEVGIK